ncbi:MAG: hypothetical protein K8R92_08970 [Planctomycetes bacterium]|nr:hypothetical protein [Planctomycetota bacterium]
MACAVGATQAELVSPNPYALGGDRLYQRIDAPAHYRVSPTQDILVNLAFDWAGAEHAPPLPGESSFGQCDGRTTSSISVNGSLFQMPTWQIMSSDFSDVFTGFNSRIFTTYYDSEMLSLHLTGSMPDFESIMIRESSTKKSLGKYTNEIMFQSDSGPLYRIQSYFDLFTELSLNGGLTWTESMGSTRIEINGMVPVPLPGVIGLVALSGIMARRQRQH